MTNSKNTQSAWDVDPIASLLQQVHFQHITKRLRSITIGSSARSEGKTTISILLARGLFEIYGFKVLYVDLNPQGDSLVSKYLQNYQSNKGIVTQHQFPFSIFRIKDLEIDWSQNIFDGPYLNRLITSFADDFDIIIVDSFNPTNTNESILKVNTDTNLIIKSAITKSDLVELEIKRDRKKTIGVIFNECL